ncbi:hypothetical protein CAPTEDRAFT_213308 [Capitella teleta]|uniref:Amino acid transporter transmembrane domain-containing protein n=1 Tax=Capitella teleta TaxID=283909 RepID=R7UPE5_CAPTE|nr:hypothetical protein CAPTEDRAFT_213308 [Capitella teleta]|eukprot:ELU08399.1 hypothetical protein CAPTEDRAFT_213308 [Capitella teleta]
MAEEGGNPEPEVPQDEGAEQPGIQGRVSTDIFKCARAMTGCGILAAPFAFAQTGMLAGILSLVIICCGTIYAAEVLVEAKYCAIKIMCAQEISTHRNAKGRIDNTELRMRVYRMTMYLSKYISLHKIGKLALSTTGSFFLDMAIILNQFGVAISCHILFGNTLYYMLFNGKPDVNAIEVYLMNETTPEGAAFILSKANPFLLIVFIAVSLPVYIGYIFLVKVRRYHLFGVSVDFLLVVTMCMGMVYACIDFHLADIVVVNDWKVFVGFSAMISGFQVIPVVLHLEPSTENTLEKFKPNIRKVVGPFGVFVLLYGFIGYLAFGSTSNQLLSTNFEIGIVSYVLDGLLLLLALIAYVVPITPVLAYVDVKLFSAGAFFGPTEEEVIILKFEEGEAKRRRGEEVDEEEKDEWELKPEEDTGDPLGGEVEIATIPMLDLNTEIPESVAQWKRLAARATVIGVGLIIALIMKDYYGYYLAFLGAVTSAPLTFIMPPYIFLALNRTATTSRLLMAINVVVITFGVIVSLGGVYVTCKEIFYRW